MKEGYTFDDVALIPQFNNIASRTDPILDTWLTKNVKIKMPILAANMDTVISDDIAEILIQNGSIPICHRFASIETQAKWVKKFQNRVFISSGIKKESMDETRRLLDMGALGVCIDVAHGHSDMMMHFVEDLKNKHPDKEIIAGNVCTSMAYHDLVNAGADAVKVGIGPGSICTTRMITGFGMPQFTAIKECADIALKLRVPLIADGGIRTSRDVVLALAAGASSVMIGKLFATTNESAAMKKEENNEVYAKYRGQASEDFQKEFYGCLKEKTTAEGVNFWAKVTGPAQSLIDQLLGGVRSGLTYGGARSIKELQRKAEFIKVTPSYMMESMPRPN
ncbi:MAG: guanosine monophosphate reductase [Parachlamydiales bacterium]|jgi:IMP dehydrogenase